ncbi:MAG TPA: hypothetical protein VGF03_04360 [Bryobacteraceae bacterium]|jgi:hypothetical protein
MRILCGLGIAVLVSGSLVAQHHGGSAPAHNGAASSGARRSGAHSPPRFPHATSMVMVPYAYPVAYGYDAPPADQSYTDSYEAAPAEAEGSDSSGPQYAAAEPPPHSLILNFEDSGETATPEPEHYYIALKDHHIYLAVAYWVEGDTLHYFLPGNTHNQVSLSLVDYDLTQRLNRESDAEVRLPGK